MQNSLTPCVSLMTYIKYRPLDLFNHTVNNKYAEIQKSTHVPTRFTSTLSTAAIDLIRYFFYPHCFILMAFSFL